MASSLVKSVIIIITLMIITTIIFIILQYKKTLDMKIAGILNWLGMLTSV